MKQVSIKRVLPPAHVLSLPSPFSAGENHQDCMQHVWKVVSAIRAAILSLQLILWFHKFSLCRHAGSEQS